jgi:TetR/AcrR family transcriptional regulator, cholesterol catabolism regulator
VIVQGTSVGLESSFGRAPISVLGDLEESFIADLDTIISTLVYGLLGRFTAGEIAVTEILPILDRAVFCMTGGYEARHARGADLRPATARFRASETR